MDSISIFNGTTFRIFISIFGQADLPIESGWLEPLGQYKPDKARTNGNYVVGNIYRIQSIIEDSEERIVFQTTVNIYLSNAPLEIKSDHNGIFWWKMYKEKMSS